MEDLRWRILGPSLLLGVLLAWPACTTLSGGVEGRPRTIPGDSAGGFPWEACLLHPLSGASFPALLAGCPRSRMETGRDPEEGARASYDSGNPHAHVLFTLSVRPRGRKGYPADPEARFSEILSEFLALHEDGRIDEKGEITLPREDGVARGRRAEIRYRAWMDGRVREVRTDFYLFPAGRWYYQYKITFPGSQAERIRPLIPRILREFGWRKGG